VEEVIISRLTVVSYCAKKLEHLVAVWRRYAKSSWLCFFVDTM